MAQHRPNLQFDILPTVTFVTIAAASLSAQRPLPAVVVRFVRALADHVQPWERASRRPAWPSVHTVIP